MSSRRVALALAAAATFMGLAFVPPSAGLRVAPLDRYGLAVKGGEIPYRDFSLEYPPGALPPIVAPAVLPDVSYSVAFRGLEAVLGAALVLCVAFLARGAPRTNYIVSVASVAAMPLLLGSLVFFRFDLWPSLLTVLGIAALLAGRERLGGASIGLAIAAKLYPAALVLPLAVEASRRRATRRAFVAGATAFALMVLPFTILAPKGVASSLLHQAGRRLQIESLGGSIAALVAVVDGGGSYSTKFEDGAFDIHGPGVALIQRSFTVAGLVALAVIWLVIWSRRGTLDVRLVCAALVGIVLVSSNVLSPQYLIWLVPLAAVVRGRLGLLVVGLTAAAEGISRVLYPSHYEALVALRPTEVALLLVRNSLLVVATACLVRAGLTVERERSGVRLSVTPQAAERPDAVQ